MIAVGDLGGDQVPVPISFNTAVAPPSNGGGGATNTAGATAANATASATKASSGQLAFTGAGPALMIMGLIGFLLVLVGGATILVVDGPRRLWISLAATRGEPTNHIEM